MPRIEQRIMELGRTLHGYGTPAHRIEQILMKVAERCGLESQFLCVPTAIWGAFGPLGSQHCNLVRLESSSVNLGRLSEIDEQVQSIISGDVNVEHAIDDIIRAEGNPPRFAGALKVMCVGLASATAARFFGGGWVEMVASGLIGLVLGFVAVPLERSATARHVVVPLVATIGTALAHVMQLFLGGYSTDVVTVSGILFFLPGLTLTVAMTELATRNLVSGTARLMVAILILLELAFGVALGGRIESILPVISVVPIASFPLWVDGLSLFVAANCYAVLFSARAKDFPVILVASFIAYTSARLGSAAVGPQLGAWLGALILGLATNVYARLRDRPAVVPLVPALILLVPGSIGFRSVTGLLRHETIQAINAAFEMGLVGVALAAGLLMANAMLPPRRPL